MSLHDDASLATVLAQLDDSTNQTWKAKRSGWAKLVRAQAAELERLRAALTELVRLKDLKARLTALHEMGHGTDYGDYHIHLSLAWEAARAALTPEPAP